MTKKDLIEALSPFKDTDHVVVEVHDDTLYEDLYDFDIENVLLNVKEGSREIRICPTPISATSITPTPSVRDSDSQSYDDLKRTLQEAVLEYVDLKHGYFERELSEVIKEAVNNFIKE